MKDAFAMNIVDRFDKFVHIKLYFLRVEIFITNEALIKILFHELENKCKFPLMKTKLPVG